MKYKICIKRKDTGKFWSIGNVKKNQWGNPGVGIKMCQEFRDHCKGVQDGEWINLAMFEDKDDRPATNQQPVAEALEDDLPPF